MTKIYSDKLPQHLRSDFAPIYIVSGDEPLLMQESCDLIRNKARDLGFNDRELHHADNSFDWHSVQQSAQSLSLFADKKLIEIRCTTKLNDKARKALGEYAETPPPDNVLLLVLPKLERATLNAKWFKPLEAAGVLIQVWPITLGQLPRWIKSRAQQMGLDIAQDALDILSSRVEGNLLAATQELEKLTLLTDDGKIDAALMAHAVADSARYDVFTLIDRALHGDARGAVKNLHGLRGEGSEVLSILWALSREIRNLIQLKRAVSEGKSLQSVAKSFGIWDNRLPMVKAALQRLNTRQLNQLLRTAALVDRATKGMHNADPWEGCLEIILGIAGVHPLNDTNQKLAVKSR
ncbi:DNA polymerase III subunit delta [Aurantivibrio plasticivorans]